MSYRITVNGELHVVDAALIPAVVCAAERSRIEWSKFGCGLGSVVLRGHRGWEAHKNCLTTLQDVGTTRSPRLKALVRPELHPLQNAFIDEQALNAVTPTA